MPPAEPPDDRTTLVITTDPDTGDGDTGHQSGRRTSEAGDVTTHHFVHPAHVQHLLSPERVELVRAVMADPPASIRALARRLDRNPGDVNRDVHALADHDVVELEEDGCSKRPTVPHDRIRVEVVLAKPGVTVDSGTD